MPERAWLRVIIWAAVGAAVLWVATMLAATPYALEDFDVYRRAAWDVRHGASVYVSHAGELTYEYFPWLAVAMVPFTWLPPRLAAVAWTVLVFAAIVGAAWLSAALAGAREWRPRYWLLALAFAPLAWAEMVQGQVNAMAMVAALAGVVALSRGRQSSAAALFVASALIKPHGLIFLPWLWLRHRRVGAMAIVTLLASLAVAGWLLQGATVADWGQRVWRDSLERVTEPPNVSLAMWATRLTHGRTAAAILALVLVAALAAVIVRFLWRRRPDTTASDAAEVALFAVAIPLISPQGWFGQFLFALPAAVLIATDWPQLRARDRGIFIAAMAVISVCAAVLAEATDQFVIDNVSLAMTLGGPGLIWVLSQSRRSTVIGSAAAAARAGR